MGCGKIFMISPTPTQPPPTPSIDKGFKTNREKSGHTTSTARRKSKVLYIKAFACLKWVVYFRRAVLVGGDVKSNESLLNEKLFPNRWQSLPSY